jgi:hypothetical protein
MTSDVMINHACAKERSVVGAVEYLIHTQR